MRKVLFAKKRMKTRIGKKAFIAGSIVDLYAYILFLVVILVFFVIFKITGVLAEESMRGSGAIFESSIYSSTYLRAPVRIGMAELTMADLIRLADENSDLYGNMLEDKTDAFLKRNLRTGSCFMIFIKASDDEENLYLERESSCTYAAADVAMDDWIAMAYIPIQRFRTLIPSFTGDKMMKVYFFVELDTLTEAYGARSKYRYPSIEMRDRKMSAAAAKELNI